MGTQTHLPSGACGKLESHTLAKGTAVVQPASVTLWGHRPSVARSLPFFFFFQEKPEIWTYYKLSLFLNIDNQCNFKQKIKCRHHCAGPNPSHPTKWWQKSGRHRHRPHHSLSAYMTTNLSGHFLQFERNKTETKRTSDFRKGPSSRELG